MNILFCGYRDWAFSTLEKLRSHFNGSNISFDLVIEKEDFHDTVRANNYDFVICAGWSWLVPDDIIEDNIVIGIHPSDLENNYYAGGSPLQHQIIDGLEETKCTLFRLRKKLDSGEIVDKEPLSLAGDSIKDIFKNLTQTSFILIKRLVENFPDIKYQSNTITKTYKRLKPKESEITHLKLLGMSAKELYNFIRCKTDPYPNAFIEDETGRLYIKAVSFEEVGQTLS